MNKINTKVLKAASGLCALSFGIFLFQNQTLQAATVYEVTEEINGIDWTATVHSDGFAEIKPADKNQIGQTVTIPEVIDGHEVTAISDNAFYSCAHLLSVSMPDTITRIGRYSFSSCYSLWDIRLSQNVEEIRESAFSYSDISYISIPEGVKEIEPNTFFGCDKLEDVFLPDCIVTIGKNAFANSSIYSFTIPKDTTDFEISAIEGCSNLEYIGVALYNESYQSVDGVLYDKDLTELIRCPQSYKGTLSMPEGVTVIDKNGFKDCADITEIVLPKGLKAIGDNAFDSCSELQDITLPESLDKIGSDVFDGCSSIKEFKLDPKNETFFELNGILYNKVTKSVVACPVGYEGEVIIPSWVEEISDDVFSERPFITKLTIPDSITTLGSNFKNCYSLQAVFIGKGVNSLENTDFLNCYSLEKIKVSEDNETYCSIDGVLFSKDKKTLLRCPVQTGESYSIPAGVELLESNCFNSCYQLKNLIIPEGVKEIKTDAFTGYFCITDFTLPGTLKKAGLNNLCRSDIRYDITVTDGVPAIHSTYGQYESYKAYYNGNSNSFSDIDFEAFIKYYTSFLGGIYFLEPHIWELPSEAVYDKGEASVDPLRVIADPGTDYYGKSAGELSYLWYVASNEDMTDRILIEGATDETYVPSTVKAGTYYYQCVVTNTLDGHTSAVTCTPVKIEVLGQEEPPIVENGLTAEMKVYSEWGTGYNAEIVIKNDTEQVFNSWKISIETPDTIENLWNGTFIKNDTNTYVITNAAYNGTILPGQSVSIGFIATKSGSEASIPGEIMVTD